MSAVKIYCARGCGALVFISFFSAAEYKKKKGIVTKYRGICNNCLTAKEREEVANEVIRRYRKSGAVVQKTNTKEHTLIKRQPRRKYDKPLKVIGSREVYIKGE